MFVIGESSWWCRHCKQMNTLRLICPLKSSDLKVKKCHVLDFSSYLWLYKSTRSCNPPDWEEGKTTRKIAFLYSFAWSLPCKQVQSHMKVFLRPEKYDSLQNDVFINHCSFFLLFSFKNHNELIMHDCSEGFANRFYWFASKSCRVSHLSFIHEHPQVLKTH